MDPAYPVHLHRCVFHHKLGVDLIMRICEELAPIPEGLFHHKLDVDLIIRMREFGACAREPAIQHIVDDGLVHGNGEIFHDWTEGEWTFFRGQKDFDEYAAVLEKWYGSLFNSSNWWAQVSPSWR